jgi:hypothetical protein
MRGVHQTVERADMLVPVWHWQLVGNDRGCANLVVIDDLQQVTTLLGGEWCDVPIISTWTRARLLSVRGYRPSPRARARFSSTLGTR